MTSDPDRSPLDRVISEAYRSRPRGRSPTGHPDENAWEAFASGTLDEDARVRLADHVVSCEACREVYEVVCALMDGAPAIDPDVPVAAGLERQPGVWRRYAPALALAATVILAVGAAAIYLATPRQEATEGVTAVVPTIEVPAGSPAPQPTPYRLAMVKPDVQLPTDLVVATRGTAATEAQRFLERFGEAIAPYREGRYKDAVTRLASLATARGDVAEVWFYLGVSQLFAGRPAEALASFDRPGVADAVGDDLLWQRAVALERLGREPEVDALVRALCERDGPYREQACAAVAEGARTPSGH